MLLMQKNKQNNQIIWLTGQPGSGKTTLANALKAKFESTTNKVLIVDGDDLRNITTNKDYSRAGREKNIITAQKISLFLSNKNFIVLVSVVAPYRALREKFKKHNFVHEIFVHTTEIRGRENFFVPDYEKPLEDFLDIDTTNKSVEECIDEIFNVYR